MCKDPGTGRIRKPSIVGTEFVKLVDGLKEPAGPLDPWWVLVNGGVLPACWAVPRAASGEDVA